jgi:hypothetical protein
VHDPVLYVHWTVVLTRMQRSANQNKLHRMESSVHPFSPIAPFAAPHPHRYSGVQITDGAQQRWMSRPTERESMPCIRSG